MKKNYVTLIAAAFIVSAAASLMPIPASAQTCSDCMNACDRDHNPDSFNLDACMSQCDRDHNPDTFDDGACHTSCDREADARIAACGGNDGCVGWADGDGRRGCHNGCNGRHNQIANDRHGCHDSCNGQRHQLENDRHGCHDSCNGQPVCISERDDDGPNDVECVVTLASPNGVQALAAVSIARAAGMLTNRHQCTAAAGAVGNASSVYGSNFVTYVTGTTGACACRSVF